MKNLTFDDKRNLHQAFDLAKTLDEMKNQVMAGKATIHDARAILKMVNEHYFKTGWEFDTKSRQYIWSDLKSGRDEVKVFSLNEV